MNFRMINLISEWIRNKFTCSKCNTSDRIWVLPPVDSQARSFVVLSILWQQNFCSLPVLPGR
jgi:hypothetical protein